MVVVDAGAVVLFKLLIVLPGLQVLDGKLQTSRIIALGVDGLYVDDRMWNSLSDTEIDEELDTENEVQIQKLQQALTQLKPDEQALVTLFYEEEKNIEEIAYIFHLTESNVKVKLHRIRKKLCNLMKEEI